MESLSIEPGTDHVSQRLVGRTCRRCGDAFDPVRPHQRFCRPSCRGEWLKAERQRSPALFDYIEPDPVRPD
jgi:hypothetical protein